MKMRLEKSSRCYPEGAKRVDAPPILTLDRQQLVQPLKAVGTNSVHSPILGILVQCLRRYTEAHPERFQIREEASNGHRIHTIILVGGLNQP